MTTYAPAPTPIDTYLGALAARLRGPRLAKRDLLAEARDSLHDAADSYAEAGAERLQAQRKAIAEFGPLTEIAEEYQAELAASYGALTLRWILFLMPATNLLWMLVQHLTVGDWSGFGPPPPEWYLVIARTVDYAPWVIAGGALLLLVGRRWLSRWFTDSRQLGRWAGRFAIGAAAFCAASVVLLMAGTTAMDPSRLWMSVPLLLAGLAAYSNLFFVVRRGRRCLALAS